MANHRGVVSALMRFVDWLACEQVAFRDEHGLAGDCRTCSVSAFYPSTQPDNCTLPLHSLRRLICQTCRGLVPLVADAAADVPFIGYTAIAELKHQDDLFAY
eukprot:2116707-Pleurochrysis_carterae.AAC.1